MNIINQGKWVLYQPVDYPVKGLPSNIMFARRETDGVDWYQFRDAYVGKTDSVWMTLLKPPALGEWVVLMTTRDITLLFPSSPMEMRLIEVQGLDGEHETFRHKRFDFDKKEFLPMRPSPPSPMQMMAEELGIDWEKFRKKMEANRS